ncbi:MAG TPA: hypothetical protein DCL48_15590 [Alphaproteobacteria bacterium]|nr:hypothetical protein [Alphaproteobacteria bacterium]
MIGSVFRATGHVLGATPFLVIPMALYMLVGQFGSHEALLYGGKLPSGAYVGVSAGAGLILIGISCLLLEGLKSTHTGTRGLVDQTLSVFLLGGAGVAFLLLPAFGTITFALLVALQLADVLLGAIISVKVARRDIGLNA